MSLNGIKNLIIHIENDSDNNIGYVVIDSVINNTSSGGVRIMEDVSLSEIKALAREMTLKYSFIGLKRGGAKSGLKIPNGTSKKERGALLMKFGQRLSPLIRSGIYFPGCDMNCSKEDLRAIYKGAGFDLGEVTDTSYFTALSMENAIMACKEVYKFPNTVSLAIEGFGNVGRYLAERLNPNIFRVVALSTIKGALFKPEGLPLDQLIECKRMHGDDFVLKFPDAEVIEKESILTLGVDILIPSARTWTINEDNVSNIQARFIVPAANAPYTQKALEVLDQNGVVCLPGFVCNSGGVYASSMFDNGISLKDIEDYSSNYFRGIVRAILDKNRILNLSPITIATMIATKRFEKKSMENGNMGILKKSMKRALSKGLFPRSVYGAFWLKEFKANLIDLKKEISQFQN